VYIYIHTHRCLKRKEQPDYTALKGGATRRGELRMQHIESLPPRMCAVESMPAGCAADTMQSFSDLCELFWLLRPSIYGFTHIHDVSKHYHV
jgi:hypothetical protein